MDGLSGPLKERERFGVTLVLGEQGSQIQLSQWIAWVYRKGMPKGCFRSGNVCGEFAGSQIVPSFRCSLFLSRSAKERDCLTISAAVEECQTVAIFVCSHGEN